MLFTQLQPRKAFDAWQDFRKSRYPATPGRLLAFHGIGGHDVYNTSVPFTYNGQTILAGRVEKRDSEDAMTLFFAQRGDGWHRIEAASVVQGLQDPFVTWIDGCWILGGVHAIWRPDGSLVTYHTEFYRIDSLDSLVPVAEGPAYMKDIRLLQLPDRRIAVFSRPQGDAVKHLGRVAAIGFGIIDSLDRLSASVIAGLPLLDGHFMADEWGGYNHLQLLKNGLIGCAGHQSWGETVDGTFVIHYYPFAQVIDPATAALSPMDIIGSRDCFPETEQKNPRAYDVCFTSGLIRHGQGRATLYTGLSDAYEGELDITDPFDKYEALKR